MSRRDSYEAQRLDQRFEQILGLIKPYLLNLAASNQSQLCQLWLSRLNEAHNQPILRNEYLFELYEQLKDGYLRAPFNKPPDAGVRLMPIAKIHRLATSSSCNELTETSPTFCEQKRSWPGQKPTKKREIPTRRSKTVPRYFDVHSATSSPNTRSCTDTLSPTVHFYDEENRSHTLRTYKERIDALNTIVEELEVQNKKLKQKLTYYNRNSKSDEIPHLHARIKQLMNEIANLKNKLTEVQRIKVVLKKKHMEIVKDLRDKMRKQYDCMKAQLENAQVEKQSLVHDLALVKNKFQELNKQNEETSKIGDKVWAERVENVRAECEIMLQEKNEEIQMKNDMLQQKELELAQKNEEIDMLNKKIQELQQVLEIKSQDDENFKSSLLEHYKIIKNELSQMKVNIANSSRKQDENYQQEFKSLKKNFQKIEHYTQNLQEQKKMMK